MVNFKIDKVKIKIFDDERELGKTLALNTTEMIKHLLNKKSQIRMVFAAAPSQNEFQDELIKIDGIEISTECPASIVRRHKHATMYLDKDSSLKLFI